MDKDQFDEDDLQNYTVVYHKVIGDNKFSTATRFLASKLSNNPYLTVGEFLADLTDSDVRQYVNMIDSEEFEEIVLLAQMLSRAEGVVAETMGDVTFQTNALMNFILLESLYRKQLIDIWRENMSLGSDCGDKIIAKRKDG